MARHRTRLKTRALDVLYSSRCYTHYRYAAFALFRAFIFWNSFNLVYYDYGAHIAVEARTMRSRILT